MLEKLVHSSGDGETLVGGFESNRGCIRQAVPNLVPGCPRQMTGKNNAPPTCNFPPPLPLRRDFAY